MCVVHEALACSLDALDLDLQFNLVSMSSHCSRNLMKHTGES